MQLYLESIAFVCQRLIDGKFNVLLISLGQVHQLLYKFIFLPRSERNVGVNQLTVFS